MSNTVHNKYQIYVNFNSPLTCRQAIQATVGAVSVGAFLGRSVAQASGPTAYVGKDDS